MPIASRARTDLSQFSPSKGCAQGGGSRNAMESEGLMARGRSRIPKKNQTNFHTICCKGFSSFLFLRIFKSDEKEKRKTVQVNGGPTSFGAGVIDR